MRVTGRVVLVPIALFPNERFAGDALTCSLVTPEPASHNCTFGFAALPVKVTFPLVHPVHPVAVGAKTTFTPTLCPAARDTGSFKPEILNSVPPRVIADTLVLVVPMLVRTISCDSDCPRTTEPNLSFAGEATSCCVTARELGGSRATNANRMALETTPMEKG